MTFLRGVAALASLPAADRLEICFAGRSNVGKSSLINALAGRRGLARTSATPGCTQQLNFYDLGGRFYLVDLPGYGHARAPKTLVARWQELLRTYLAGRPSLRRAFVLIDSRHGIKAIDQEHMALLDRAAVSYQIVLTKADKVRAQALAATLAQVESVLGKHPAAHPELVVTSAETGEGIPTLRALIAALAEPRSV